MAKSAAKTNSNKPAKMGSPSKTKTGKTRKKSSDKGNPKTPRSSEKTLTTKPRPKKAASSKKGKSEAKNTSKKTLPVITPEQHDKTPMLPEILKIKHVAYNTESIAPYNVVRFSKNGTTTHRFLRKLAAKRKDIRLGDTVVFPLNCLGSQLPYVGRVARIRYTKQKTIEDVLVVVLGRKKTHFIAWDYKHRGQTHIVDLCLTHTVDYYDVTETEDFEYMFRGGLDFENMSLEELAEYAENPSAKYVTVIE